MKCGAAIKTNTELLCLVLGWQGGTVHQVAAATGLAVDQIINGDRNSEKPWGDTYWHGWSATRTCSLRHNHDIVFPKYMGDVNFWMGAARGKELQLQEQN